MPMLRNMLLAIVVALPALFARAASGQVVTGTIVGTVKDNSGAVIAKATVTITNTDQNFVVRAIQTDANGQYSAPLLPVGHYTVTAEAPGFKKSEQTTITLNMNANLAVFGTGTFGAITSVRDPRIMQLAMKLYF